MTKVTGTVLQPQLTGGAMGCLAGNTQSLIENSILCWLSPSFNIIHAPIRNLDNSLVDNVLVRLNAKLDLLELLGRLIDDLMFDRGSSRSALSLGHCRHVDEVSRFAE